MAKREQRKSKFKEGTRVKIDNGSKYIASVYTYGNIIELTQKGTAIVNTDDDGTLEIHLSRLSLV